MDRQAGKGVGFRRNIFLEWLDAAATARLETSDAAVIRSVLTPFVAQRLDSSENIRVAVDILVNIWVKSESRHARLHASALDLYRQGDAADRLWLHYGMTMLVYDFFAACTAVIGQLSRTEDEITPASVKRVMIAERGALGALDKAVERVIFSLRDWGILLPGEQRSAYTPQRRTFATSQKSVETWLLAVALTLHRGDELPFVDLMRRPELFPFAIHVTVDELRTHPWFAVHRQGIGMDMVRLKRVDEGA